MTRDYDSFVFVHIEKCGGTSIRHMVYDAVRETIPDVKIHIPGITCNNAETLIYIPGTRILDVRNRKVFCVADHSHYGAVATLLGLQNPFYFTVLREPFKRLISHYYFFFAKETGKPLPEVSEHDIITIGLETEIANLMTIKLAGYTGWTNLSPYKERVKLLDDLLPIAKENILNHIQVTGFLSRLDDTVNLLNRKNPFGFTFSLPDEKLNTNKAERPVTDRILELMREYCRYDIELYDFALKAFERECGNAD